MIKVDMDLVVKRSEIPGSKIDDEFVFFNRETGSYYGTGPVGANIWDFLEMPKSINEICEHLLSIYDVDRAKCESQVNKFISDMIDAGIVDTEN